jgi:CheY-like chemotaxis protein
LNPSAGASPDAAPAEAQPAPQASPASLLPGPELGPDGPSQHRQVLVAEDDRVTQRLALHMLRRFGYRPTVVPTGRAAIAAVESSHFDIILMDCFMPEVDGFEAAKVIRRLTSGLGLPKEHGAVPKASGTRQRPYIIALTAQAMPGDRERCYEAGMDDYVSKPIEPAELKDALQRGEAALHARDRAAA